MHELVEDRLLEPICSHSNGHIVCVEVHALAATVGLCSEVAAQNAYPFDVDSSPLPNSPRQQAR